MNCIINFNSEDFNNAMNNQLDADNLPEYDNDFYDTSDAEANFEAMIDNLPDEA